MKRAGRIALRSLKWVALTLVALVTVAVVLVALVLYTRVGTRVAFDRLLAYYDTAIPGSITLESYDGRLGSHLRLSRLRIADRVGDTLLEAETVELDWNALALVRKQLSIERLELHGASIRVPLANEPGSWSDLAPPAKTPQPPNEGAGPDLKIAISGTVIGEDVTMVRGGESLLAGASIKAHLTAAGRQADLAVDDLAGTVPAADLELKRARFELSWRDPMASVDQLYAATSLGELWIPTADIDAEALTGQLQAVARGDRESLQARLNRPLPGTPVVHVRAEGGSDDLRIDATAALGDALALQLHGRGDPRAPDLGLWARIAADPQQFDPHVRLDRLVAVVQAHIGGGDWSRPVVAATVRCTACGSAPAEVRIDAQAAIDRLAQTIALAIDADIAGLAARGRVRLEHGELASAAGQLNAPDLARLRDWMASFVTVPEISGSLAASVRCRSDRCWADIDLDRARVREIEAAHVDARIDVDLGSDAPVLAATVTAKRVRAPDVQAHSVVLEARGTAENLELSGRTSGRDADLRFAVNVQPGPPLQIGIDTLEGRARGIRLQLEQPATVRFDPRAIVVDDLRLALGRGQIVVNGTLARNHPCDLTVELDRVALSQLDNFLPGVRLSGTLSARAVLDGGPRRPTIDLTVTGRDVAYDDLEFGDLELTGRLADRRLAIDASARGGNTGEISLSATAGVAVDLSRPSAELLTRAPIEGRIEITALQLERLQAVIEPRLRGAIAMEATIDGTPQRPVATLGLVARDARLNEQPLGDLELHATYDDRQLRVAAGATAPFADHIALEVDAPVDWRWTGKRPRARLSPKRPTAVSLVVRDFELEGIRPSWPDLEASGRVSVDARLRGPFAAPEFALEVEADRVHFRDTAIGFARVALASRGELLVGDAEVRGPLARELRVQAELPVVLSVRGAQWSQHGRHRVAAEITDLRLAPIAGWFGVPLTGTLSADVVASSMAGAPRFDGEIDVEHATWGEHELGDLGAEIQFADAKARAELSLGSPKKHHIVAHLEVPVAVDMARRRATWLAQKHHVVEIGAIVEGPDLLAVVADMPAATQLDVWASVVGTGSIDDFEVRAESGGRLHHKTYGAAPFRIDLRAGPRQQVARVRFGPAGPLVIRADATTRIPVAKVRSGQFDLSQAPVEARVQIPRMRLEALRPFVPKALFDPEGSFFADAKVAGTFADPKLDGYARLRNGEITIVPMQQRLRRIEAMITLQDRSVSLERLTFTSGKGKVRAEGIVRLGERATTADARMVYDDFPLVAPGLPFLLVDADIKAHGEFRERATEIDIAVDEARVDVYDTARVERPHTIPKSDSIVFVDRLGERDDIVATATDAARTPTRREPAKLPRDFDLTVRLTEPLIIVGANVDMRWRGAVELQTRGSSRQVEGGIVADGGNFDLLGNRFDIQTGVITLPPDEATVDPYLNVVATTDTDEGMVTATVRGRASKPALDLSSDPRMRESEIFTLLVTGSSQADSGDGEVEAKAANLLATFQNPALRRQLKDKVGIDRAAIGFGESIEQPILTVGKRISKKVMVATSYHHNAPEDENDAEMRVEYRFARKWVAETFFGNAGEGGVNVYWRTFFGKNRPAKSRARPRKGRNDGDGKDFAAKRKPASAR